MAFRSKLPDTGTTIFTVMSQLAAQHNAINLSQGFPDFPCHPDLLSALERATQTGNNQYAPMAGLPALREAIATKILAQHEIQIDPVHEITVTAGATQAIFTAIAATLHAGDEAILFDPSYDSYAPSIITQGAKPVRIPLCAPSFAIDWDRVKRAITPKTRLLIINNPNNPATSVLGPNDLEQLAILAETHDLIVLSDEVYEHHIFDEHKHLSVLAHASLKERSFAVYSFGKTFHATGWKIGYCVAPPTLAHEFRKVHQYLVFCVNTPAQHAIAEHLSDTQHWQSLPSFFTQKRDQLALGLQQAGFETLPCQGSYFLLANYEHLQPTLHDLDFARWLTIEHGVACIPLSPFYADGRSQHIVRFCFAKQDQTLQTAINRLSQLSKPVGIL